MLAKARKEPAASGTPSTLGKLTLAEIEPPGRSKFRRRCEHEKVRVGFPTKILGR